MTVLSARSGVGSWFAERTRTARQFLQRCTGDAVERLFGADQVYREITEAEQMRDEIDVVAWRVILRPDGTGLAEHRLTGQTIELSAEETAALKREAS